MHDMATSLLPLSVLIKTGDSGGWSDGGASQAPSEVESLNQGIWASPSQQTDA